MEILNDYQTSVRKALREIDPDYLNYEGLIVCGTHNPQNTEEIIEKIRVARVTGRPFLGICFGHQLAAIEYARNILGIKDATSEELEGKCKKCNGTEVYQTEEQIAFGYQLHFCESCLRNVNGQRINRFVVKKRPEGLKVGLHEGESWWSNYDVVIKTDYPKHFITVPYHPEYQSSKEKPHLILLLFLSLCRRNSYENNN